MGLQLLYNLLKDNQRNKQKEKKKKEEKREKRKEKKTNIILEIDFAVWLLQ